MVSMMMVGLDLDTHRHDRDRDVAISTITRQSQKFIGYNDSMTRMHHSLSLLTILAEHSKNLSKELFKSNPMHRPSRRPRNVR